MEVHMNCTKNYKKFGLALGLLTVFTAMAGLVGCTPKSPEARMNWVAGKVTDKLDLNKEQEAKLKDLIEAINQQRIAHKSERKENQTLLKDMVLSEKLNHDVLRGLIEKKETGINASF